MTRVQRLTREIEELTSEELAAFRKWFQEYDAAVWDEQIERDAAAGKLDKLAEKSPCSGSEVTPSMTRLLLERVG